MKLTFVEAPWFTARLKARMGDELYRALQNQIAHQPDKGQVMPGCGGLRKLRYADRGRGKGTRGGLRVIYLYIPEACRVDFFDVYGKDEKDDLTPREKKILTEIVKAVRQEALDAYRRSGGLS